MDRGAPLVEVQGLVRRFGDATALAGLDLRVGRGQILALLGHNGAGKTTLLRIVNGLLRPSAGAVSVFGRDPYRHGAEVRARTGAVTESTTLDEFLSVRETLEAFGRLFDVPAADLNARIDELIDAFELAGNVDQPARELSAGMRQRAAFARALVHRPELLLLDEPTANMDPVAAHRVRHVVAELARDTGSTVIMSTHNLAEAQDVCDRIAVLRHGQVLQQGSLDELSGTIAGEVTTRVEVASPRSTAAAVLRRFGQVHEGGTGNGRAHDGEDHDGRGPGHLEVAHTDRDEVPAMVAALVAADVRVVGVTSVARTLEDVYLDLHQEIGA